MKNDPCSRAFFALVALIALALPARAEYTCELSFLQAPSTALANFPVLVRLAEDAPTDFHYADCPTGGCIWFTDASDNAIPCDVDTWDTTGESLVWVSVPSLSDATKITMHWDAAGAPSGLPASSNVWSRASYVGVWHMNEILEETSTGKHYTPDSSASGWNAYKANEADAYPVTISDAGNATSAPPTGHAMVNQLGGNRNIGGFLVPASATSGTTIGPFTVSFFEECTSTGNDRAVAFGSSHTEGCVTAAKSNTYVMAPGGFNTFDYSDGLADNAWRHIAGVFDTNLAGYVGGAYRNLNKNVGNKYSITLTKGIGLGTFTTQGETFTGYLDEIRIRNVASTGEWVAEEYKTVTTANYVTFGDVETGVEVLRLRAVAVSDVTPTNAVVTGELRTLGEGATSADVWLVYTDGTTTNAVSLGSKSAEPSALSVALENLTEKTAYTCWFTATNNLSAGADSATATFKTKRIPTGTGIYECELSFPSAPATPLVNFPVLVRLANDAPEGFLYEDCPTAAHLWFTDGYDTVLPFEADTWNTAGESLVWVSVPSFSSSTTITMHWSSDAGSVEDSPAAREVWTRAGYNAVWHFSGSNAESVTNLVPSATRGTPTYDGNVSYPGPVGKTLWLNGSSDLRYDPDPAWTTLGVGPALSVSFWVRHTGSSASFTRMVSCMSAYDKPAGYEITLQNSYTKITVGSSDKSQVETAITTGPNTAWKHFAGTWSATAVKFYDDGDKKNEATLNAVVTPTEALTLGGTGGSDTRNPLTGGLDEIRIRRVTSSDDWVAAEYATMAMANYVSFGDVEEAAAGVSLEFGTPFVSSVSATGAIISARLKSLGENATSANLWVVVSGFGQTRTYPLVPATGPKVVEATLSGLQPGADWTAYLTATNNASPAVGTNSAAVVFSTDSDAGGLGGVGLYQAVTASSAIPADAAANWDIAASGIVTLGPLAMRCALSSGTRQWQATDGSGYQWSGNTGFGYAGCMYMEAGKDYYFGGAIDDAGYVWVDNGDANWDAKRGGSQLGGYQSWNKAGPYTVAKTGFRRVVFSCWNGGGGAGAESGGSVTSEQAALRYAAVANGAAAPGKDDASWLPAVDPGDGSLFRLSVGALREVSVLSAVRDGTLLSARVAVDAAAPGEMSKLRYVFGTTHGGDTPADWEGCGLVASALPAEATTNDVLVGIAADTRYVRFYIDDDGAIAWSSTISLDWVSETEICDGIVFTGPVSVSSVTESGAVVSAHLGSIGNGATAADVWAVVTGFGRTRTFAVTNAAAPATIVASLSDLQPGTEWTVYFTATNNASTAVGTNSAAVVFSTVSDAVSPSAPPRSVSVLSAVRDGTLLSARVALDAAAPGETSVIKYVFGTTHGGDDPAEWEGCGLVDSALPAEATTNDYLVGIAADTRYVRFYIDDNGAIAWSSTISLDWVSETEICDGVVFTDLVSASSVTDTGAVVTAHIISVGDSATVADVWAVVTSFGRTRTFAVTNAAAPATIVASLSDLQPGTEWTVYFTATNNASTAVGTNSAAVVFTTVSDAGFVGTPGLYQAASSGQSNASDAAHGWNIAADGVVTPGPQAMRNANSWTSADGTTFQWANGAAFAYTGYMYMESGKDYYFSAAIDDAGYAWVNDGSGDWYAARQSPQFNTAWKADGPYNVSESGYHQVVFSAWNNSGGAGATGNNMLRYVAVAPGASAPAQASADWLATVDPGDGSLFLPTPPVRAVSVVSARRDGTVVSAKVALEAAVAGETSELLYVYGATHGGNNPTNWTGRGLVDSSPATSAVTNDYLVGIASDTRYIRFYTKSGDSVNWSATIAVEWAEETTLAETFVFTGEISASDVATTNATILGHLAALGDGATSADVWLVLSGFGQTKTYAVTHLTEGAELSAALSDLIPGTEWTVHFTATNNLGAGADSPAFTFSTLSDAGAAGVSGFYQVRITSQNTLRSAATLDIVGDADGTLVAPAPHGLRAAVGVPWYSTDGTQWTYGGNTGYGYSGYMFMEGGKDYYFSAGIDDEGHVWVDNGAANWDAAHTASQFPSGWAAAGPFAIAEDGWYHVVFAGWNGGGNGGANGTYGPLRYIAVESGASAPVKESTAWIDAVDPGDGSLFLSDKPSRKVAVLSADRDGDLLSAKVALGAAFAGETSVLRYVYGASNGGNDPADWEGGSLVSAALPPGAVTNDYLVGIAANTRFVRFYATDGISLTWSDTIALEWAGETEIADTFLFLGDPDAAGVTADAATLSAVLNAPGGGASSAEAWFVVAGGGETFVFPAGTANGRANLSVSATGLTPETAYTFYATATNNAAAPVGVDSATGSFTTGPAASAWNTGKTTWTFDGKSITATVPVTSLGIGTTTVELKTGSNWNVENTVSASATVTEPGVVTLTADFSDRPWGTKIYYSLALVNGTAEYAITNWPNVNVAGSNIFYNKTYELQDNSTYTWVGGATGVWNDTNNWIRTATGSYAATGHANYPVFGSTAVFATDVQTTVTIPATEGTTTVSGGVPSWTVSTLNLTGMDAPLVFTAPPQGQTCYFYIASSITATKTSNRLVFDGCLCQLAPGLKGCGASAYDAENGGNLVVTFTGGATAQFGNIEPSYPGVKIRIDGGSLVKAGHISAGSGNLSYPTVIEIEDAELRCTGRIEPDTNGKGSTIIRFLGQNPKFAISYFSGKYSDGNQGIFEFVVPVGGYFAPPLHFYGDNVLGVTGNHAPVLRVSPDSPALAAGVGTTNRLVNAKISAGSTSARVSFDLPTGVTMSTYTDANGNADGYVVEIPAGAGPALADVAIAYAGDTYFDVTGSVDPGSAGSADIKIYVAEGDGAFAAVATTNVTATGAFRLRVANRTAGTAYRWYAKAVSASGSHATEPEDVTFRSGIASVSAATVEPYPVANGDTVYKFTDSTAPGSITFAQGGLVEVLVVGGGGGGGNSVGGGGGGGAFLHRRAFVPAGTYAVAVGKGGYNETVANNILPVAAESSSIGTLFVAAGGGAGGCWDIGSGTSIGGSAGGNSFKVTSPVTSGTYPFGHDGGVSPIGNNKAIAGGGGGAGGVGGDGRIWDTTYTSGYGGDGVACDITGESVVYAAGGGGGASGTDYVAGAAGLGGVPGCSQAGAIRVQDAPANTGAGGGGGNYGSNYLKQGGAGGSGIVVVRVLAGADDGTDELEVKAFSAEAAGNTVTVTGSLLKLGAGADSANVWLVVTGGGATRSIDLGATNAVPAVFSCTVDGLGYGTDYTCFFTATNNAATPAGADSDALAVRTPGNDLYYSEISFPYAPATPLENFPVLVRISSASPSGFSYANCPTADKLWFLDDTGAVLPFEVDTWNPQGESLVWVSVPNFSASTTLTMQWAVDAHSRPVVPAATEVWSRADYVAVWHMNELLTDGIGTYTPDATTNGWKAYKANEADAFPLADTASSYAASTPPTGRAMISQLGDDNFTTGGFLVPASLTSGTTIGPFSISLFEAYVHPYNNKYSSLVSFASAYNLLACMRIKLDACYVYNDTLVPWFGLTADGQANNAWRHLASVWDAVPYGYLNGVEKNYGQKNWNVSKTLANGIGIGTLTGHTETQQGYMDEVRIRNAASSADWMAAEYATVMEPAYAVFEDAEIDTGAPRIGKPSLVEASGTGATIAATVVKLGDNATQADIWLVLEGGTETLTYPVGTATAPLQTFTNTVSGLEYSTVYTAHFTVTNNAAPAAGADSKTVSFETETLPADWNTDSFALSGSGKTLTASINVTDLGTGTTTLYLMTGPNWNTENTVSATSNLTATGVHTFTLDCSDKPWGTSVYVSFLLVNGTEQNAITNGPYTANGQAFYNKYVTFQDNSTYTWIGGAAGDWNDPANWELTSKGSLAGETPAGYPVYGSTAYFKTNIAVTVAIPATAGTSVSGGTPCWYVNSLNMSNMSAPLTFVSTSIADECRIQAGGISADNANLDVTFDGCYFNTSGNITVGANAAIDGHNAALTFRNGARGYFNQIYLTKPAAKLRVLDGAFIESSYLPCGTSVAGDESKPVLEVCDAKYISRSDKVEFDWGNATNGLLIRLSGTHPRVSAVNFLLNRASGGCIEFVVPAGGYADAPIHFLSNGEFNSAKNAPIRLRVSPDSPALKAGFATTTRLVDAKIVDAAEEAAAVSFDAPAGVTMSHHTNEDGHEEGYDCTIPAGNGPVLSDVGVVGCDDTSVRIGGTVDKAASIKVYVAVAGGAFVQAGSSGSSGGSFLIKARNLVPGVRYRWYVEAATASGSHRTEAQEFTFRPGKASVSEASVEPIWVGDEKVYVFTDSTEAGSITFAQGGLVEVLVIGGGGAGGNAMGGGGGAGAFLYRRDFIPAGTYAVTVGKGGYNTDNNQNNYAVPAEASSIGDVFVAPGGGAGGRWGAQGKSQGGSAGGNSGNAWVPAVGTYPFGRDGGSQTTGGSYVGSGGGGGGGAGHDARTWGDVYYGGRGGDGVVCSITGEEKIYAAGGGGGVGSDVHVPGSAGLGGVRGCGMSDTEIFDAPANTGSGGGGGNYQNNAYRKGGAGGSGIVVIRVKRIRAQPTVFIVQ